MFLTIFYLIFGVSHVSVSGTVKMSGILVSLAVFYFLRVSAHRWERWTLYACLFLFLFLFLVWAL